VHVFAVSGANEMGMGDFIFIWQIIFTTFKFPSELNFYENGADVKMFSFGC
jgi:hypothetical protein